MTILTNSTQTRARMVACEVGALVLLVVAVVYGLSSGYLTDTRSGHWLHIALLLIAAGGLVGYIIASTLVKDLRWANRYRNQPSRQIYLSLVIWSDRSASEILPDPFADTLLKPLFDQMIADGYVVAHHDRYSLVEAHKSDLHARCYGWHNRQLDRLQAYIEYRTSLK